MAGIWFETTNFDYNGGDSMEWILIAFVLIVASFFFIPIRLMARITGDGQHFAWEVEAVFLCGMLRLGKDGKGPYITASGLRRSLKKPKSPAVEKPNERMGEFSPNFWRDINMRIAISRLLRDIWSEINASIDCEGVFGLEDPALTGWVKAVICACGGTINLQPDFINAGARGRMQIICSVRPFKVVDPVIRFGGRLLVNLVRQKCRGGRELWQA
jgi:hypothetical protein